MSCKTIKGEYIELTYSTDSYRIITTKIQLGDCLFAQFDETASYLTYKHIQDLAQRADQEKAPTLCIDLAPAHVYLEKSRVRELYDDFEKIIEEVKANVAWPENSPMQ